MKYIPGDFILTHGTNFFAKFIYIGQRIRFHGKNKKYSWWSHAAMIINEDGGLVESKGHGVNYSSIKHYEDICDEYIVVSTQNYVTDEDRKQITDYAKSCVGQKYGFLTIFSTIFMLLFGIKFFFGIGNQSICSGLVASALEKSRIDFPKPASHVTPADLAYYFKAEPGKMKFKIFKKMFKKV